MRIESNAVLQLKTTGQCEHGSSCLLAAVSSPLHIAGQQVSIMTSHHNSFPSQPAGDLGYELKIECFNDLSNFL